MKVERLDWDSEFFGLRIGRAEVPSAEDVEVLASKKGTLESVFDLVYVFSKHGLRFPDVKAELMDEKVVYVLSKDVPSETSPNVVSWEPKNGTTDDLLHLALVSGKYSR